MDNNDKNEVSVIEDKKITYGKIKYVGGGFKSFLFGILGGLVVFGGLYACMLIPNSILLLNSNNSDVTPNNNLEDNTSTIINQTTIKYENPVPNVATVVGPSVVGVTVEYMYSSFFGNQQAIVEGSGVIISSDGYIITNNHVVDTGINSSNEKVYVYLSNSTEPIEAEVIGKDAKTDMAVIKIDCTDLSPITMGNSSDLQVGDMVVAIGNPLGLEFAGSVTVGYVSALNREVTNSNGSVYNTIQTDAAINSGNSGGALVNTKGELVGINSAKIASTNIEGICFAIPIDDVKDIIDELIKYKKVIRPDVGIEGINVDEATKNRYNLEATGVYIRNITTFGAAEIAGLKVGDIIIKINDIEITSIEDLNKIKNKHEVGDTLKFTIIRNKEEKQIDVILKAE